jgi:KDO2-lipid IV(A) lauroyltransferase
MPSASVYRAGELLARRAPSPVARAGAWTAALAAAAASGDKRMLVRRNLERALGRPLARGEATRRTTAVFNWYARYYLESLKLPSLDASTIDAGFGYEGVDAIERAARSGTGPILVMPHLGTWEWAAWWLALIPKMKVSAVVEPLEPPEVFEWFTSFRQRLGMDIIPLGPDAGGRLAAAIRRGDVVCLLADRDVAGNGVEVDFFGERTRLPAGPALLALRTGAPLIPAAVYWRGSGRHAVALPPLDTRRLGGIRADVSRVVQAYAAALEHLIRAAPEQWHLMSPNWPSDYEALGRPVPEPLRGI